MQSAAATRSRRTAGTATGTGAAYFDDGTPLGSAGNDECRIDSIAQSWARAVGRRRSGRGRERAMAAVDEYLVRRGDGLVLLFTPPFDHGDARSRLHQGLRARHPRERRPVHARGDLVGARLRRRSATATRRASCSRSSIRSTTPARPPAFTATRSSRTSMAADVYARAAAHRPRRLDLVHRRRPAGCTRPASSGSSGFRLRGTELASTRASHAPGPASRSDSAITRPRYEIVVENRTA